MTSERNNDRQDRHDNGPLDDNVTRRVTTERADKHGNTPPSRTKSDEK